MFSCFAFSSSASIRSSVNSTVSNNSIKLTVMNLTLTHKSRKTTINILAPTLICNKTVVTSCAGGPQYASAPCKLIFDFDLESGVPYTCDVGYICANFSLRRPLCSRLRPNVCDRQTDVVRRASSLNALWGRRHNNAVTPSVVKNSHVIYPISRPALNVIA